LDSYVNSFSKIYFVIILGLSHVNVNEALFNMDAIFSINEQDRPCGVLGTVIGEIIARFTGGET